MAWTTLIKGQTRPTGLILSSMPTTANFMTKENLHRIHLYLCQFAMERIGGCGLLMSTKKNFMSLTPINKLKKDIPESRVKLNKFVVRFNNFLDEGVRWGGTLNGGRTGRGSRVYPTEWSTYREEIDDFRYRYGPNLLLHKMNKIRDQVIWESEAIRLPKPSTVLSSLYCKFTSGDLDSK
ncbi:hypothetical protein AHAS_Ahas20G0104000 [Arachis hypogaea]